MKAKELFEVFKNEYDNFDKEKYSYTGDVLVRRIVIALNPVLCSLMDDLSNLAISRNVNGGDAIISILKEVNDKYIAFVKIVKSKYSKEEVSINDYLFRDLLIKRFPEIKDILLSL